MDVFNKLRSAVSSALPGNPLSKDFDVSNHIASGGPGLSWKIYSAIKRTTKQVSCNISSAYLRVLPYINIIYTCIHLCNPGLFCLNTFSLDYFHDNFCYYNVSLHCSTVITV